jgi:glycosyltransferase involved in cell wall biosynthesis
MKIMLASRNFYPSGVVGGAQASMLLLAKALERKGHEVAILSVDATANRGLHHETQLQEYRLELRNVYTQKSTSRIAKIAWHIADRYGRLMREKYEEAIRDFKPDVINTNVMAGLGVGFWEAASACSVPVVHTVHDYYLLCIKSDMYRQKVNCQTPCLACRTIACATSRRASQDIREVIYVSTHMMDVHERARIFPSTTHSSIIAGSYAATEGI